MDDFCYRSTTHNYLDEQMIKAYVIALPVFFAIDMIWLALIARGFYTKHIGYILAPQVNWMAAIVFYLIFVAGLVFFSIMPAFEKGSVWSAIFYGAFFGFVTYSAYDLTNLATVKDWPMIVTIVDLAWGSVLGATVSAATYLILARI